MQQDPKCAWERQRLVNTDQDLITAIRENEHDPESLRDRLAQILAEAWAERLTPQPELLTRGRGEDTSGM